MTIAREAALAHVAYVPEVRHPVEVTAAEEKHLVAWLSKRLDAPLRAPSLVSPGTSCSVAACCHQPAAATRRLWRC